MQPSTPAERSPSAEAQPETAVAASEADAGLRESAAAAEPPGDEIMAGDIPAAEPEPAAAASAEDDIDEDDIDAWM